VPRGWRCVVVADTEYGQRKFLERARARRTSLRQLDRYCFLMDNLVGRDGGPGGDVRIFHAAALSGKSVNLAREDR